MVHKVRDTPCLDTVALFLVSLWRGFAGYQRQRHLSDGGSKDGVRMSSPKIPTRGRFTAPDRDNLLVGRKGTKAEMIINAMA